MATVVGMTHPDPLLADFRRSIEQDLAALRVAMAAHDLARVTYYAHRMRGACAFVAQDELAQACHDLELAGRGADEARADSCCWLLIEALRRFDEKGDRAVS
jgi:HPt (histidine-containing phosphotransfer) domain-containing protein